MDRGDWRAMAHGVAKSQTRLKDLACTYFWGSLPQFPLSNPSTVVLVATVSKIPPTISKRQLMI